MGEKLVCHTHTSFSVGGNLVYTRFVGRKFEYIPIFVGGNVIMGKKLGCITGNKISDS
jgi:hypothetical protein